MTMALVLEHTQQWFREKYNWEPNQCGVQPDAKPPNDAGHFYVGIDDAGIEGGRDDTASLLEIPTITIGIWMRPEHLSQKDQLHNLKFPEDKYIIGSYTLHSLERMVIINSLANKTYGLHHNWEFMNAIATRYGLPDSKLGGTFYLPFFYRGRGRMESAGTDDGESVIAWWGVKLRFRGMNREQVINNPAYALG